MLIPKRNTGRLGDDEESVGDAHPRPGIGVKIACTCMRNPARSPSMRRGSHRPADGQE